MARALPAKDYRHPTLEGSTASRVGPELDLRDSIAQLLGSAPEGALRDAAEAAAVGVENGLGPAIAAAAGDSTGRAALPVALLQAAERADAAVHDLGGRGAHERAGEIEDNRVAALAAAWLRAGATELAAELGEAPLLRLVAALGRISHGYMREAEDLYDAGRTEERYFQAADGIRGGLGSFAAAAAAGTAAGIDEEEVEVLAIAGGRLAMAAGIRDEARALVPGLLPDRARAGEAIARGVYSLPVVYALADEPKLAGSLGGAISAEALGEIVSRVRGTGALTRCVAACRGLTEDAGPLAELAAEVCETCEQAEAA
jgi:hypothetical protein